MSENLHDIDKLFRDSLDGHEEMPSDKVWDALDNNLDKTNVIQIKKKYNNLKRIAIALLLLLMGTIVYEIQSKKTGKEEVVTNNGADKNNGNDNKNGSSKQNVTTDKTNNNNGGVADNSNGTASGSREVTSAGKDAGINSGKETTQNTNAPQQVQGDDGLQNADQKTLSGLKQKHKLKVKIKNPAVENGDDVANENTAAPQGNKLHLKKSSDHKTTISIKNAAATEDINDDEDASVKNATGKNSKDKTANANSNELRALQNEEMKTVPAVLNKSEITTVNVKRASPDANVANVVAKNKNISSAKPFHFNIMPFYSPQFSFNHLEDDRRDPGPQPRNGREQIKENEPNEKSSSFGVLFEIPVGKKWGLQSGFTVLNKEITIEPKNIFAKLDNDGKVKYRFDCSSGYTYISPKAGSTPVVGDSVVAVASTNTLQYVGIPLALNYTFSMGKFSIIPTLGAAINFLTKQKIETELVQGTSKEKQTISNIQGLKKIYYNAFAGVELDYNVNKKIALSIMPVSNFALSSINKDAAVKSYPNSFGVAAGVKIKF